MPEIYDWGTTSGTGANNSAPPDGFPENMDYRDVNDSSREVMAVLARFREAISGELTTTGTQPNYTLTTSQTISAYAQGQLFGFFVHANATGNVNLNVNGLGNRAVYDAKGTRVGSGDWVSGGFYFVTTGSSDFRLVGQLDPIDTSILAYDNIDNSFSADQTILKSGSTAQLNLNSDFDTAFDIVGNLSFIGHDDGGNDTTYNQISSLILDPTGGSEDGVLRFRAMTAGSLTDKMDIREAGIEFFDLLDMKNHTAKSTSPTISSGALSLDIDNGNDFDVVWDANITSINISNWPGSNRITKLRLRLAMDSSTRTVTWPSGWYWENGTAPTLPGSNEDIEIELWSRNSGTKVYARELGQGFATV